MWKSDEWENVSYLQANSNDPPGSTFGEFPAMDIFIHYPCYGSHFSLDGHPVNGPAADPLGEIKEET